MYKNVGYDTIAQNLPNCAINHILLCTSYKCYNTKYDYLQRIQQRVKYKLKLYFPRIICNIVTRYLHYVTKIIIGIFIYIIYTRFRNDNIAFEITRNRVYNIMCLCNFRDLVCIRQNIMHRWLLKSTTRVC